MSGAGVVGNEEPTHEQNIVMAALKFMFGEEIEFDNLGDGETICFCMDVDTFVIRTDGSLEIL